MVAPTEYDGKIYGYAQTKSAVFFCIFILNTMMFCTDQFAKFLLPTFLYKEK